MSKSRTRTTPTPDPEETGILYAEEAPDPEETGVQDPESPVHASEEPEGVEAPSEPEEARDAQFYVAEACVLGMTPLEVYSPETDADRKVFAAYAAGGYLTPISEEEVVVHDSPAPGRPRSGTPAGDAN